MPPKISRLFSWLTALAASAVILALLALALILWRPALVQPLLLRALTPSGGSASLGSLEFRFSPLRLEARDLKRREPGVSQLSLAALRLDIDPAGFWGPKPWLRALIVDGLQVTIQLKQDQAGEGSGLESLAWLLNMQEARVNRAEIKIATGSGIFRAAGLSLAMAPQADGRRELVLDASAEFTGSAGQRLAWAKIEAKGQMASAASLEMNLRFLEGGADLPPLRGDLSGEAGLLVDRDRFKLPELSMRLDGKPSSLLPASLSLSGEGRLDGAEVDFHLSELRLGSAASLTGKFQGGWKDGLNGRLEAVGSLEHDRLALRKASLQAGLAGSLTAPLLEDLKLDIPQGGILWQGRALALGAVKATGQAGLRANGDAVFQGMRLLMEEMGALSGDMVFSQGLPLEGALKGEDLQAAGLSALAHALGGLAGPAWQAQGKLSLEAGLSKDQPGQWRASLQSRDLGFSSPDGSVLVGQLAGQLEASGSWRDAPRAQAQLKISAGQALWGTVFLDLAKAPLELSAQAQFAGLLHARQVDWQGSLKGYGDFSGRGSLNWQAGAPRHQASMVLRGLDLAKLFVTFIRDPLTATQPELAAWRAWGSAQLELNSKGNGLVSDLSGRLRVSQAGLAAGGETSLAGVAIDLPFAYHLGKAGPAKPARPAAGKWGSLSLEKLKAPGMDLEGLKLSMALTPNRLWAAGALEAPLAGGKIILSDLRVDEPLSAGFKAKLKAQVENLDLAQLAGPALPLSGNLSGRLASVRLDSRSIQTKGQLQGELFGGALTVKDLAVKFPFNPGRETGADIQVRGVHLEPLSQATQIGRITGRVDVDLSGLRLAYGQPVAFDLQVKSVETPGVAQRVSLKAVNSISLLGTGSGLSGMGLSLFASFFHDFPYEKIAFSCALDNDVFRIKGLIHEDGVEYLVKRPLLMGINVINRNPDNRISFSGMLERLQRVRQDNSPGQETPEAKEAQ